MKHALFAGNANRIKIRCVGCDDGGLNSGCSSEGMKMFDRLYPVGICKRQFTLAR